MDYSKNLVPTCSGNIRVNDIRHTFDRIGNVNHKQTISYSDGCRKIIDSLQSENKSEYFISAIFELGLRAIVEIIREDGDMEMIAKELRKSVKNRMIVSRNLELLAECMAQRTKEN